MKTLENWLTDELSHFAEAAQLVTADPGLARYKRPRSRWRVAVRGWLVLRPVAKFAVGFSAVLFAFSAAAAHSVDPKVVVQQAAAAIQQCSADIGGGRAGGCGAAFFNSHVTTAPSPPPPTTTTKGTPALTPVVTPSLQPTSPVLVAGLPFSDNFRQDTAGVPVGWVTDAGTWSVGIDGTRHYLSTIGSGAHFIHTGAADWAGVAITVDVKASTISATGIVMARYQDDRNYVACAYGDGKLLLSQVSNGSFHQLASKPISSTGGASLATVGIKVSGSSVSCGVLSQGIAITGQTTGPQTGFMALSSSGPVQFSNVTARVS